MITELTIGQTTRVTSTEAARILGISLSRLKQISKKVLQEERTQMPRGSAKRFSGRDIRNIQLYVGKLSLGFSPEDSLKFVRDVDTFLEEVARQQELKLCIKELGIRMDLHPRLPGEHRRFKFAITRDEFDKRAELEIPDEVLEKIGARATAEQREQSRRSIEEMSKRVEEVEGPRRKVIEESLEKVKNLTLVTEKCGFDLSVETQVKSLFYLITRGGYLDWPDLVIEIDDRKGTKEKEFESVVSRLDDVFLQFGRMKKTERTKGSEKPELEQH